LKTLELLHQEINANAISVPSNRGNGMLGHYALVVPAATHDLATGGIAFIAPVNPGASPNHPAAATAAQITETNRQFLADGIEFRTYLQTESRLKKLLLEAVPATFTQHLMDRYLGFANVTTLAILNHLDATYGELSPDDLDRNMVELEKPWDPSTPIETLFQQLRHCQQFAVDTDPISDLHLVRSGLRNVERTGMFVDAIRDWRKRPVAEKTIINFRTDFAKADEERNRQMTAQNAGYHTAAVLVEVIAPEAMAAAAVTTKFDAAPPALYYCWSHGAGVNKDHTGATCKFPAPGHRGDATVFNMLGGCNIIHRRRNEKPIYKKPERSTPKGQAGEDVNS
jgi:hypothetical protein